MNDEVSAYGAYCISFVCAPDNSGNYSSRERGLTLPAQILSGGLRFLKLARTEGRNLYNGGVAFFVSSIYNEKHNTGTSHLAVLEKIESSWHTAIEKGKKALVKPSKARMPFTARMMFRRRNITTSDSDDSNEGSTATRFGPGKTRQSSKVAIAKESNDSGDDNTLGGDSDSDSSDDNAATRGRGRTRQPSETDSSDEDTSSDDSDDRQSSKVASAGDSNDSATICKSDGSTDDNDSDFDSPAIRVSHRMAQQCSKTATARNSDGSSDSNDSGDDAINSNGDDSGYGSATTRVSRNTARPRPREITTISDSDDSGPENAVTRVSHRQSSKTESSNDNHSSDDSDSDYGNAATRVGRSYDRARQSSMTATARVNDASSDSSDSDDDAISSDSTSNGTWFKEQVARYIKVLDDGYNEGNPDIEDDEDEDKGNGDNGRKKKVPAHLKATKMNRREVAPRKPVKVSRKIKAHGNTIDNKTDDDDSDEEGQNDEKKNGQGRSIGHLQRKKMGKGHESPHN